METTTPRPRGRRLALLAALAATALTVITPVGPADAATTVTVDCRLGHDLQLAIAGSLPDDTIVVRGTCRGRFIVSHDLTLRGTRGAVLDAGFTESELPGDATRSTLQVSSGATVSVSDLTLRGGFYGLRVLGATVDLRDSAITGNRGGLHLTPDSAAVVTDSTIGHTFSRGVGAVLNQGVLRLSDTDVVESHDVSMPRRTIDNLGVLVLHRASVSGNSGLAVWNTGDATIVDSTIRGNRSGTAAGTGGIGNAGQATLRRTAVVSNLGVGISNRGTMTVQTSTIANNHSDLNTAAIDNRGDLTLLASTVARNDSDRGRDIGNTGTLRARSSVLIGAGCGGGITSDGENLLDDECVVTAPRPTDVVHDGGELEARGYDGPGSPYTLALPAGSPGIDAVPCATPSDQRGVARPQQGACDIGAHENQAPRATSAPTIAEWDHDTHRVSWEDVADADGDAVSYVLQRRDADDPAWSTVGDWTTSTGRRIHDHAEGTWRYRVLVTDGRAAPVASVSSRLVVDLTPPAAPTLHPDRPAPHRDAQGTSWWPGPVEVTVEPGADPELVDGSAGTGTVGAPTSGGPLGSLLDPTYEPVVHRLATEGTHTVTETSVDHAGNVSPATELRVGIDLTPPAVTIDACPTTVVLGTATHVTWTAIDAGAGIDGADAGSIGLDTGSVGTRTATITARDLVGHESVASCSYDVVYAYTGFGDGEDAVRGPAGRPVSVEFSLGVDAGLDVLRSTTSIAVDCASGEPLAAAVDAPGVLEFDGRRGEYSFAWDTDRGMRRTCHELSLLLDDDTTHTGRVELR